MINLELILTTGSMNKIEKLIKNVFNVYDMGKFLGK